uniref:glycerol kinase n=1 Tax=Glossina palpalis gambiensis TaxID=67801 RepID=A0A1B0BNF9_9MUSC
MTANKGDANSVTGAFDQSKPCKIQDLVGVINGGTSSVSFSIYSIPEFKEIASHQLSVPMISLKPGWYEQDAMTIINKMYRCVEVAVGMLPSLGYKRENLVTLGITNQRETTVMWDGITGKPLHNAIVWNDIRTSSIVDKIIAKIPDRDINHFRDISGLPISPYFPALKMLWLMENASAVQKACKEKRCLTGTIDSWIIWCLTKGKLHITDATNASRTLLMNIGSLQWDSNLLKAFSITDKMLPQIRSSSEIYGTVTDERSSLLGVKISGILGNQQASLLGQMCIKPGQAKNTYRAGCFLLCNTGRTAVISRHGLLTTVAYKLGPNIPATYALEGAVAVAGHALKWLEHQVRVLPRSEDAEKYAGTVTTTGDVYFVPAFTGLYAPYWQKDARGVIIGLTQFSNRDHIIRAALESICFQTRDILEIMYEESNQKIDRLQADGQLSKNNLLMQLQADTVGIPVFRSQLFDCAPFGIAMCAAQAVGIDLCRFDPDKDDYSNIVYDEFKPASTDEQRKHRYGKWKRAVQRSFNWSIQPTLKVSPNTVCQPKVSVSLLIISSSGAVSLNQPRYAVSIIIAKTIKFNNALGVNELHNSDISDGAYSLQ